MIERKHFGTLPTGERVDEYTLSHAPLSLSVTPYGGIVTQLHVPDRYGKPADIVLGFNTLDPYLAGHPYFGCIAGRVAGRLTKGKFSLDGIDYTLALNDSPNHLHGGKIGLDKRLWNAQASSDGGGPALRLTYFSPAGEEGYPGNVRIAVTYSLPAANELVIAYEATTDQATPLSLTNHNYYNLAGEGSGRIDDHVLQIFADDYAPADEAMTLIGRRDPVAGLPNDFIRPRRLGDAIPGLWKNHGDVYFIRPTQTGGLAPVARLFDPFSGRIMTISSTEPCLQLYTGVGLDHSLRGKSGRRYGPYGALCLESEGYPNAVNDPHLGNVVLRPGATYRQTTRHEFSVSPS